MGCCLSVDDTQNTSKKFKHVRRAIFIAGGVLLLLGLAALVVGSIATFGGLPASLIGVAAIGASMIGCISSLPSLLTMIDDLNSPVSNHDILKARESERKALEAQGKANEAMIIAIEDRIAIERDEEKKKGLQDSLNEMRIRLSKIEDSTNNRANMNNIVHNNLREVKNMARSRDTLAGYAINENTQILNNINRVV